MLDAKLLANYIEESGLQYATNQRSYIFSCPRCSGKKKLYISRSSGHYVCFKCKELNRTKGSRPEYILCELLNVPVGDIKARLYGEGDRQFVERLELNIELFDEEEDFGEIYEEPSVVELPANKWPYNYYPIDHEHSERGKEYLEGRGIPLDIAKQYDIHYCPVKRRVSFPASHRGVLYGWQDRLVIPHQWFNESTGQMEEVPKILSSRGLDGRGWRERMLMFMDRITSNHAVLCEGPVDAIKAHLCGGNVATMGKEISQTQLTILDRLGVTKLYLGLDPDAAATVGKLVRDLSWKMEVYQLEVPSNGTEKVDLGALSFEAVYDLFRAAKRLDAARVFIYIKPPE